MEFSTHTDCKTVLGQLTKIVEQFQICGHLICWDINVLICEILFNAKGYCEDATEKTQTDGKKEIILFNKDKE